MELKVVHFQFVRLFLVVGMGVTISKFFIHQCYNWKSPRRASNISTNGLPSSHETEGRANCVGGAKPRAANLTVVPLRRTSLLLARVRHHLTFFAFLGPHPQHMEVPRLGAEAELQWPVYATATVTPGPSSVCDLHHSSQQRGVLNPLSKAREQTATSRFLVRFVSTAPRWELQHHLTLK